jgi:hypothetical protein
VSIPRITDKDIAGAFGERRPNLAHQFRENWNARLGHLFECPSRGQIELWLKICGFDMELLLTATADLERRANWKTPLNAEDPYRHAMAHFSSTLVKLTRARYGQVRPQQQRKVAA